MELIHCLISIYFWYFFLLFCPSFSIELQERGNGGFLFIKILKLSFMGIILFVSNRIVDKRGMGGISDYLESGYATDKH